MWLKAQAVKRMDFRATKLTFFAHQKSPKQGLTGNKGSKGTKGDVAISAEKNGDVRIKGRNIILDATENIELTCGGKINLDSSELIATTQNTTRINARKTRISGSNIDISGASNVTLITPKGPITVKRFKSRDVDWAKQVFAGTAVAGLVK